jgi:hypothetical protein
MTSFLKSMNGKLACGRRTADRRRAKFAVERLEDRMTPTVNPSVHYVNLMNDHFAVTFAGDNDQLTITNENTSTGQISGGLLDRTTGLSANWNGKLTWANTTMDGYQVENLAFRFRWGRESVSFSGTVYGPGSNGTPFGLPGYDWLSGTARFSSWTHRRVTTSGPVSGNDVDPIRTEYNALGGAQGLLGKPASIELATRDGSGFYRTYQNGAIYWSYATGAHYLEGPIWAEYQATAQERDYYGNVVQNLVGLPTSDEMSVSGVPGARMNTFQHGAIYWSPDTGGAHVVYGAIGAKYDSLGGPAVYGMPTSDEQPAYDGDLISAFRVQYFQNDPIVWSAQTGHTIYGAIAVEWANTVNQPSFSGSTVLKDLGPPTSEEMNVPGVPGARMSTFESGAIYWTPNLGAHVVYGFFSDKYNQVGGPAGSLGLPTDDPQAAGQNWVQYFQNGSIIYTPANGVQAFQATPELDYTSPLLSFGGGNPINARMELKIFQNGSYDFSWNFNNYGYFLSYNTEMAVLLTSPSGHMWFFDHQGYAGANNPTSGDNPVDQGDTQGNLIDVQLEPSGGQTVPWVDLMGAQVQVLAILNGNGKDALNEILAGGSLLTGFLGAIL